MEKKNDKITNLLHNEASFEKMFHNHYPELFRFARNILYDEDEAKDVVQETFLDLWRQKKDIEIKTSLRSYLFAFVKNRALNRIQHLNVVDKHQDQLKEAYLSAYNLEDIDDEKLKSDVNKMLSSLPEQMRRVVECHSLYGWTYEEVAEELGIGVNTVKTHMRRAFKKLRVDFASEADYKHLLMIFLLIDFLY